MNTRTRFFRPALSFVVTATMLGAGSVWAAAQTDAPEAVARYQQERAACISGQSSEDQATCLREAGAALAEAKRGTLDNGPTSYRRNALQRCQALPDGDRLACAARMQGMGTTSGSVSGGGILRELVIQEVGVPSVAAEPDAPLR